MAAPPTRTPIVIDTLAAMVRYGTFYHGHCDACFHASELDMADLIRRLGPGYPAAGNDLGRRLICTRCGQRGASVLVGTEAAQRASPGGVYGPSAFAEAPVAGLGKESSYAPGHDLQRAARNEDESDAEDAATRATTRRDEARRTKAR